MSGTTAARLASTNIVIRGGTVYDGSGEAPNVTPEAAVIASAKK